MVGRPQLKTVGHIPREISRREICQHVYFSLKEENGQSDVTVHSVNYRPSHTADLKFQKRPFPLYYTYKNLGIRNFTLFIRLRSKGNRTIIIRRGGGDQYTHKGIIRER